MKMIDISQEVFSCRVFPGDPAPAAQRLTRMEDGALYNLSAVSMCAHNGTHADAPLHFCRGGKTIDELGLAPFVGPCCVARHEGEVGAEDAEGILRAAAELGCAERILIAGKACVTAGAARVFAEAGILLLGNESQTVGPEDAPAEVHLILLGAGAALLEGLVLDGVEAGRYFLSAAPLKLGGFEGAPCRAVLIEVDGSGETGGAHD